MINKITKILLAVTAFVVNLAAQEAITFSDFIAEDGSGIDKQEKQYNFTFDLNKSNQTKILTGE